MLSEDTCIITIGFYTAHFTAYQPETRGGEEFCEDLPDASQTVFVLDYLHGSLKQVPVDFRILRNMTDLGDFVRWEHLEALGDLTPHTVFYQRPQVRADERLAVEFRFPEAGEYIGVVTAGHPTNDSTYVAVFPFEVGGRPYALWLAGRADPARSRCVDHLAVPALSKRRSWLRRHGPWVAVMAAALIAFPTQWYPMPVRMQLARWFGPADFRPLPAGESAPVNDAEPFCPAETAAWRPAQTIDGVPVMATKSCVADNPHLVAAAVRGTNNVSSMTLMNSGLTADAVEKGADLDGDGDPDEIHIRLEVAELNGASAESNAPVAQYALAPGVEPGLWVFAPKFCRHGH